MVQMIFLFIIVIGSSRDIFARNDLSSERPYVEPSLHLGYEDSNASLIPNGSMFYPSLLYQHQVNASRLQLAPQRINGVFSAEESAIASGESKSRQSRHSQRNESLANLHVDTDVGPRTNMWGLSAERSPLASNLTEDDILEMTYEEYLEAHSRGSKRSHHPVSGPSRSTQRSLGSEENCDDSLQFKEKAKSLNLTNDCIEFLGDQAHWIVAVVAKWWLLQICSVIFGKLIAIML
ncbi:hypothetical protein BC332_20409 [Capsicum chinense]|nr:hypothetical protein BC332_20409 [Capsicum chinense]